MIRHRLLLKSFAVFFIVEMVVSTFLPTVTWALTAGPTSPEATSFEPVDTTDMVNMVTGDFVYNLPVLEVPGPAGGYPLSLSYHADIQPNEEASWVGLGFNLNPGAITRNVNGFADDHLNVENVSRFFWEGGETHTVDVAVNVGISEMASVSAGLSFSQDTYRGFGVGSFAGVSVLSESGVGLHATVGVNPYGGTYASVGIGVQLGMTAGVSMNLGVGVQTNFNTVSSYASAGVSVGYGNEDSRQTEFKKGGASLLGASISSSNKGQVSSSIGGVSNGLNNRYDQVSSYAYGLTIPLYYVSVGYKYQRYWIDETSNTALYGGLYNPTGIVVSGFDKKAFDSYTLPDPNVGVIDNPDPDKVLGGSFINYDNYSVNAQGVNGSIRPYSFKNLIFRQNRKKDNSYELKQFPYSEGYQDSRFEFRFIGDFSNQYLYSGGELTANYDRVSDPLVASFTNTQTTGKNNNDGISGNHLAGSRNVEWYTNNQIIALNPSTEKFRDCNATGFKRSNKGSLGDQIGGFMISNETGVTYHFALPVYTSNEYQYSENINKRQGEKFNEISKPEPYAYTWLLTALSGPDYVDRGPDGSPDGKFNEYDWGYWVEFQYGKWTEHYTWRNPSEGMMSDLDQNFQNFSEGQKWRFRV